MRKIIQILIIIIALSSCINNNEPFVGYIVCKEYSPASRSFTYKTISEAGAIPMFPFIPPNKKKPLFTSKFVVYIANKNAVKHFEVDSLTYSKMKLGHKWQIQNN